MPGAIDTKKGWVKVMSDQYGQMMPLNGVVDPKQTDAMRMKRLVALRGKHDWMANAYQEHRGDKIWTITPLKLKYPAAEGGELFVIVHVPKEENHRLAPDTVILSCSSLFFAGGYCKDKFATEWFMTIYNRYQRAPTIISVGVRPTPECKWPAPVDDLAFAYDAIQSPEVLAILGTAPTKIGLLGTSASATMMSHLAVRLAQEKKQLDFLALHAPLVDPHMEGPAYKTFGQVYTNPEKFLRWAWNVLLTEGSKGDQMPSEEAMQSVNLLQLPWDALKDVPILLSTAGVDCTAGDQQALGALLKEKCTNVLQVNSPGLHGNAESQGTGPLGKHVLPLYEWYFKMFGFDEMPKSSKM